LLIINFYAILPLERVSIICPVAIAQNGTDYKIPVSAVCLCVRALIVAIFIQFWPHLAQTSGTWNERIF